jgi:uncharacterized Tic20 family protein
MASEPGDEAGPAASPAGGTGVEYDVSDEEKTWGVLTHVSALSGLVVPFGNVIGPLVVWLLKKDESRFVDENGTQALNFQITWTVLIFVSLLTVVVGVGLLLVPVLGLAWLILVVIATVRASERVVYDYPLTIDVVS